MRKFHAFQLWFLIPGFILMAVSIWVPVVYAYKQILWTRTEALIGEQEVVYGGGEPEVYVNMEFTDANGVVHHIRDNSDDDFNQGSDEKHLIVYYDPSNPANYLLANHGRYLLIIFIPFAWLVLYLGWPHKEEPEAKL